MIASIRNPHVKTLCELARDDESVLALPLPDAIFGFHAQQACEKLLKALIASRGATYGFTHNLENLMDGVEATGETLPELGYDLLLLQPFAVTFRYDLGDPVAADDKDGIRGSVKVLREFVLSRVVELEAAGT